MSNGELALRTVSLTYFIIILPFPSHQEGPKC
jgi:hypothetical protein